jgi:hypothetical protein
MRVPQLGGLGANAQRAIYSPDLRFAGSPSLPQAVKRVEKHKTLFSPSFLPAKERVN